MPLFYKREILNTEKDAYNEMVSPYIHVPDYTIQGFIVLGTAAFAFFIFTIYCTFKAIQECRNSK